VNQALAFALAYGLLLTPFALLGVTARARRGGLD
jgi:hypothetical protein